MRLERYFDSSALAKRYLEEPGSASIRRLLEESRVTTSRLTEVEIVSAVCRCVRSGTFSPEERDRTIPRIAADSAEYRFIELTSRVASLARDLLALHPLRASDAIQLASCLTATRAVGDPMEFVAFDERLLAAARAEGLAARLPA